MMERSPFDIGREKLLGRGARFYGVLDAILLLAGLSFPVPFVSYLCDIVCGFLSAPTDAVIGWSLTVLLNALLYLTVGLPLIGGVYYLSWRIFTEGEYEREALSYAKCFRLGLCKLRRYALPLLLLGAAYIALQWLLRDESGIPGFAVQVVWAVLLVCAVGLIFCYFLLARRGFMIPFYVVRGSSYREAAKRSRRIMNEQKRRYRNYTVRFFAPILLSVLSVGVLYALDTYPRMMMTYFALCEQAERASTNE